MLTTQQNLFRKFWHAIMPVHELDSGPKPFRLMGVDIVLFRDAEGTPRALRDRCCHRTARLSKGWCEGGNIVCGYHGWTYDGTGRLVRIPQLDDDAPLPEHRVDAYWCMERYGYAWVSLEEPIEDLFDIPEDRDPAFRRIFQFYETWKTAPLRMMENSFDNAHFAFVHQATFGNAAQPKPKRYELVETDYGFYAASTVDILNPPEAHQVTGDTNPTTTRKMQNHWYLPFCRRMDMEYPSGIRHIIINSATPIDDHTIQLTQLLYRNDTEADCPTAKLIEWDWKITQEDKEVLESTDFDATVDISRKVEAHMPSDRPGIVMRKRLLDLLRQNGEEEIFTPPPPPRTAPTGRIMLRGMLRGMLPGPGAAGTLAAVVARVSREAERVVALDLVAEDGGALPAFAAGAHIDVHIATGIVRQYSLCGDPADRSRYRIAVLLEAESRGGSATIHDAFHEGRRVRIGVPRNVFGLAESDAPSVLIAGGIGVTPLIAMAHALHRRGAAFTLHYCAHSRATAPFLGEIEAALWADRVRLHFTGGTEPRRFDAVATLAEAGAAEVYVCGPARLQDGVAAAFDRLGLPAERLHRERFTADVDREGAAFSVLAARSGITVTVPPGRSIAQMLEEQGIAVPVSCEQGVCGTCVTRVLEGAVDHRDLFLSPAEKATNARMTVCCSRARAGERLVLDV
jgi:ferredoxin-NADP reductase/phenylpropionate dioxygenase-like ring-hydroxylating dioxygenase large terminal subunit